jgi:hypothetical protein
MGAPSTNFFQKLIQIHKMWLKLAKIGNNWPIFKKKIGYFHVFQVVEHTRDRFRMITLKNETFKKNSKISFLVNFANFSHNLWSKNHVLKKVGRGSSHYLFSNWYFLILHALGYPKSVTDFFARSSGSTRPSAWCEEAVAAVRQQTKYFLTISDKWRCRGLVYKKASRNVPLGRKEMIVVGWSYLGYISPMQRIANVDCSGKRLTCVGKSSGF